jgi:hypothetical protein
MSIVTDRPAAHDDSCWVARTRPRLVDMQTPDTILGRFTIGEIKGGAEQGGRAFTVGDVASAGGSW